MRKADRWTGEYGRKVQKTKGSKSSQGQVLLMETASRRGQAGCIESKWSTTPVNLVVGG